MLTFFSSTKITIRVIKSVLECLLVPIKAIKVIVMVTIKFKCRISVLREGKKSSTKAEHRTCWRWRSEPGERVQWMSLKTDESNWQLTDKRHSVSSHPHHHQPKLVGILTIKSAIVSRDHVMLSPKYLVPSLHSPSDELVSIAYTEQRWSKVFCMKWQQTTFIQVDIIIIRIHREKNLWMSESISKTWSQPAAQQSQVQWHNFCYCYCATND